MLQVIYRTPFGIADPVFSRDIGFYVFTLPALAAVLGFLTTLTVISLLLLIPLYWMRGDIVAAPTSAHASSQRAGQHLALLLAAMFLLTAVRLWLVDIPGLLFSTTGPLIGASYTDLHARLPALRVSAVAAVLAAVAVMIGGDAAATATLRSPGRRGLPCRGRAGARSRSRWRSRSSWWRRPS